MDKSRHVSPVRYEVSLSMDDVRQALLVFCDRNGYFVPEGASMYGVGTDDAFDLRHDPVKFCWEDDA